MWFVCFMCVWYVYYLFYVYMGQVPEIKLTMIEVTKCPGRDAAEYLCVNSPELFSVSFTLLILSQHDGDDVIVTYC